MPCPDRSENLINRFPRKFCRGAILRFFLNFFFIEKNNFEKCKNIFWEFLKSENLQWKIENFSTKIVDFPLKIFQILNIFALFQKISKIWRKKKQWKIENFSTKIFDFSLKIVNIFWNLKNIRKILTFFFRTKNFSWKNKYFSINFFLSSSSGRRDSAWSGFRTIPAV